jgi:hypothetical protein
MVDSGEDQCRQVAERAEKRSKWMEVGIKTAVSTSSIAPNIHSHSPGCTITSYLPIRSLMSLTPSYTSKSARASPPIRVGLTFSSNPLASSSQLFTHLSAIPAYFLALSECPTVAPLSSDSPFTGSAKRGPDDLTISPVGLVRIRIPWTAAARVSGARGRRQAGGRTLVGGELVEVRVHSS